MPTLPPIRIRDCEKKKRYRTAAEARHAARKLFWRTDAQAASFYACSVCHGFHVTSQPARREGFRRF